MIVRPSAVLLVLCIGHSAHANAELDCLFDNVCVANACQTAEVAMTFSVTDTGLSFEAAGQDISGTALPHIDAPSTTVLFTQAGSETLLFSLSAQGAAVLTRHSFQSGQRLQVQTLTGRCEAGL